MTTTVNKPDLYNFLEGLMKFSKGLNDAEMTHAVEVFTQRLSDENFLTGLSGYTKRQTDNPIVFVIKTEKS